MSDEAANRAEAERLAQFAYDRTTMSPACRRDLATLMCESLREAEQRGAINHMVDCVSERNAAYQRGLAEGREEAKARFPCACDPDDAEAPDCAWHKEQFDKARAEGARAEREAWGKARRDRARSEEP